MSSEDKVSAANYLDSVDFDSIDSEIKGDGPDEESEGQLLDDYVNSVEGEEEEDTDLDDDDFVLDEDGEDKSSSKIDPEQLMDYTLKLKINGEEVEASVQDLADNYQLGVAARDKFNEASKLHKEASNVVEALKNPETVWDALEMLGHDVDRLADMRVVQKYQLENMDPRERQLWEKEQAIQKRERELEQRRQNAQREQQEKLAEEYKAQLRPKIEEALESNGMPKSQKMFIETVKTLKEFGDMGERLSFDQAARLTKRRLQEEMKAFYETTPEEELERLGAKGSKKKKPQKPTVNRQRRERTSRAKKQFKNSDEFFKSIRGD